MRPALPSFAVALIAVSAAARAQPADIDTALRSNDWLSADQLAQSYPDPIAVKLVTYYRLMHQGDGRAAEIAAFIAANPDWPGQATLLKRRDEALAGEPDDAVVLPLCMATPAVPAPQSGSALARCADAANAAGHRDDAVADARTAWVAGFADAFTESAFLKNWQAVLTPADQQARFRMLLAANAPGVTAQVGRLAVTDQKLARARLAVRSGDPHAAALVAALPADLRDNPDLVLDETRVLRKADQDEAALDLWTSQGFAAERAAGAPEAAQFWVERGQLARKRLHEGDTEGAFRLAADGLQTDAETAADSAFLAGFIALRKLNQPDLAQGYFRQLGKSTAAISQARAHYWLGRTAAALHDDATARSEYGAAAAWPTTYYGQLALLALGGDGQTIADRIAALGDPTWTGQQALDFAGRELSRAAAMLVAWGDPPRARAFLQQVQAQAADPATRSMNANFALGLGLPDEAVAVARRAGRDGTLLPGAGWPLAADPPEDRVPAAVSLGIIRQESSFDSGAVSPSGARGLMQLMPGTAAQVGQQIGAAIPAGALNTDPAGNMKLGAAYLGQLIDQFDGSLPLAIAAYNAGPARVQQWLGDNGDPRTGSIAMIDWIELIPFSETRNYVQRVIENIAVYRAKRHEALPYPVST